MPTRSGASPIEKRLWRKAKQYVQSPQGLREPKVEDVFTKRYYISPQDLFITNYLRRQPAVAFNPGALEREGKLLIFPRLVFDYYSYVSSIGVFELDLERLFQGQLEKPLKTKIILWPKELWEFGHGCEDPRVSFTDGSIYMLYTGARHHYERDHLVKKSVLGFAELDQSFEIKKRDYFSITNRDERFVPSNKDSAFVEVKNDKATILTRPDFRGITLCWRAKADLKTLTIPEETLTPVLGPEEWEHKVGWSTNTIKLSSNKYLVGWHGVVQEDLSYRNGLALVNEKGELLAITDYLLTPKGVEEQYGDRSFTIFGNGLIRHKDCLIWIGGVSDYAIGVFVADMKDVFSMLRKV